MARAYEAIASARDRGGAAQQENLARLRQIPRLPGYWSTDENGHRKRSPTI